MKKKSTAVFPNALNGGLYIGLALIIFSLITWAAGIHQNKYVNYLTFIILGVILFFTIKSYRDQVLGGAITYGRVLGYGVLASLTTGVILAIYTYLFFTVIDPDAINQMRIAQEEAMFEQGLSAEQVEMSMEIAKRFSSPLFMSFGNIFGMTFLGFIFSLIEGIFLKREGNPFDTAMADIDEDK
ncbi:MAG: DUF4199 domain-containing protein [Bacteroidales bacterium]